MFAIGDIARNPHGANDVPVTVGQRQFGGKHPTVAPIWPGFFLLFLKDRVTSADDLLLVCEGLLRMFAAEHIKIGFVDCLGRIAQSKSKRKRLADKYKTAFAILEIDTIGGMLEKSLEQGLLHSLNPRDGHGLVLFHHRIS